MPDINTVQSHLYAFIVNHCQSTLSRILVADLKVLQSFLLGCFFFFFGGGESIKFRLILLKKEGAPCRAGAHNEHRPLPFSDNRMYV